MPTVVNLPCPEKRSLMERMVFHGIVFNMSWEDPEMDREAFRLTSDDTVISITSAGCNPLNFLAQSPRKLISVDSNPAQTAVLELKLAALATVDHATFFDIFAARNPGRVQDVYRPLLRPHLSARSQAYWDKNLWMVARGLYNYGRMGLFCRLLRFYLHRIVGLDRAETDRFFDIQNLDEQRAWYHEHVAPRLWRNASKWFVRFKPFMFMAGVHPNQFKLVDGRHDMFEYVKERVEYALTEVPIYNNYFLSLAVTGRFRGEHVPPYLLEENFDTLRNNLDRVEVVNGWLGPYLDTQPRGSISKFNLLDIFDWMPPQVFEQTLHSVLRAAAPNATLIYRSGSYSLEPPASVRKHLIGHEELAAKLLARDRSATYGSFYIFSTRPDHNADAVLKSGSGHVPTNGSARNPSPALV